MITIKDKKTRKVFQFLGLLISLYGIYYDIYYFTFNTILLKLPYLIYMILFILPSILFPYFLYKLLINVFESLRQFIVAITMLILIFVWFFEHSNAVQKYINKGGVIVPALITDKTNHLNSPPRVYWSYQIEDQKYTFTTSCAGSEYKRLKIGDTILIAYSITLVTHSIPINYFPSSAEINRFKDGAFYFDEKIVDSLPNYKTN